GHPPSVRSRRSRRGACIVGRSGWQATKTTSGEPYDRPSLPRPVRPDGCLRPARARRARAGGGAAARAGAAASAEPGAAPRDPAGARRAAPAVVVGGIDPLVAQLGRAARGLRADLPLG